MDHVFGRLSAAAREVPASGIIAAVNHGRGKAGLIPLWAGEGDLPTPDFINAAAMLGLAGGETFYTWQAGIPELRQSLAAYHRRHFGREFSADEFIVTIGGMQAIVLSLLATCGAGDEAIYLTPAWPNFGAARSGQALAATTRSISARSSNRIGRSGRRGEWLIVPAPKMDRHDAQLWPCGSGVPSPFAALSHSRCGPHLCLRPLIGAPARRYPAFR